MICHVFKSRRKVNGKSVSSRVYTGRYRLAGESRITTIRLGISDKQAAEAELRRIVNLRQQEKAGLIPATAVRDAADRRLTEHLSDFLEDRTRIGRSPDYVRQLRGKIERLISESRWQRAGDITADSFLLWRERAANLSPKTLNEYHNALEAFLNWMKRQRRGVIENPMAGVERISQVGARRFYRRALSPSEIGALLGVAGKRRALYTLAIYSGLRRGEMEKLEWRDINLDAEKPFMRLRATTTKNRRSAAMGVHPVAANELRKFRSLLGEVADEQRIFESVFPSPAEFRADLAAAGIKDTRENRIDFHSLRHTFGTMLSASGVQPRTAMELMRHSEMRLTMIHYTDPELLPTEEGLLKLPNFLSPEISKSAQSDAQISAQQNGADGQTLSQSVAPLKNGSNPQTLINTSFERGWSPSVADSRQKDDGARCRVRTCDFLRVKQALYH